MPKTFLTDNLFIRDKFAKAIFANPVNSDYVIKYILALEQKENIEILSYEVLYPEINTFKNLKDRVTDAYGVLNTSEGLVLLNTEFNCNYTNESFFKNLVYICHMLLKYADVSSGKVYTKCIQININNFDVYGEGKFVYKEEIFPKYRDKENVMLTRYNINVALLRKMSYDDIRKLNRDGLEYLSLICITNNKKAFIGDKIMLRIVKELDAMQKNYDELIYYDPKKFHEAEMKEIAIEKSNLAIAKKLIEKGSTKDFVIEITDITENQYEDLVNEIQKETKKK
ncbi:MAG: hypothetical protein PUH53_01290 [Mycoplasma sp.]|nr:hypothetical protein [Mycoplasma sp.]